MQSKLRLISIGIVAENKERESNLIQVMPVEIVPFANGEIQENTTTLYSKGIDAKGEEYALQVDVDSVLTAEWFSLETNRRTSPDVMRGEQVMVWQYGDVDKYYWTSMGRNDELRRGETVIYRWSNHHVLEDDIELDDENSYRLIVSTHDGIIELITNTNNEEPFAYRITLNTADGFLQVTDDVENRILLNSAETLIELHNQDTTRFALTGQNIEMFAPDSATYEITNTFDITCNALNIRCETMDVTASSSFRMSTPTATVDSPDSTFTGNVKIGGGLEVAGASSLGGGATVTGDAEITGSLQAKSATFPDGHGPH